MICSVAKSNLSEAVGGKSGSHPCCTATPTAFFYGASTMNCKHITCPLLEISLIPLTQGKYAIVDTEDYAFLMRWKWHASQGTSTWYAERMEKGTKLKMHRAIMNVPKGMDIDHRNHYGLDNRRQNIRVCTRTQNQQNQRPTVGCTSKYKGVSRESGKWRSRICIHNRNISLGAYESEIAAARVYAEKAKELFGEFACLNFHATEGVVNLI